MNEKKVNLRVVSPHGATDKRPYKIQKDADMVILRCITGDLGIMHGRMPCTMVLGAGVLRILDAGREHHVAVLGGVAHVEDNIVTVLTDAALLADDIDKEEVDREIRELESGRAGKDAAEKRKVDERLKELRVLMQVG